MSCNWLGTGSAPFAPYICLPSFFSALNRNIEVELWKGNHCLQFQGTMSETVTKKHLDDHPLQWNKHIKAYNCEACKEAGHGPSYHCSSCKTNFHGDCATAPDRLPRHPFYPDSTDLMLVNIAAIAGNQGKSCRACGKLIRRFGYCDCSGLYFHSCCARLPESVKELKMVLIKEVWRDSGNCALCNSCFDGRWAYCFEATGGYAHVWCVLCELGHAMNLVGTMSLDRSEPDKCTPRTRSLGPPACAHPQGPPISRDCWAPPPQGPHAYYNQWAPQQVPLPPTYQGSYWHPPPCQPGYGVPYYYHPPQWPNQWYPPQGQWPPLNGNFYFPPQGGPPPCGINYWASHPGPSSSNQPPSNNSLNGSFWEKVSKWGFRFVTLALGVADVAT